MAKRKANRRRKSRRVARKARRVSRARRKVRGKSKKARPSKPPRPQMDPKLAQVMKAYEEAMRHFNHQNFRRAKDIFEKVLSGSSRELAERARVHLRICEQRLQQPERVRLRTADDHYHYAVSQINLANYEDARTHLQRAAKQAPKADYIHYALASVAALSGEFEDGLKHLAQAIKLRPENRYHARNDADFRSLEDDPRFQELLYPERPAAEGPGELRT